MNNYLAKFKVQPSYLALSTAEKVALLKKEWLYGQMLALRGIRTSGFLEQKSDCVYGFYRAESEEALYQLLDCYPTTFGHYAICEVAEVVVTQDGRLSIWTPLRLIAGYLKLLFFKVFYHSKVVNGMLEKRIAPQ